MSRTGEFGLIRWIRDFASSLGRSPVHTGIGDDAAVLSGAGGYTLASVDAMIEGVHFDLSLETPYQVGYRAVASNVSDIHAMDGNAGPLLVVLGAPPSTDRAVVESLYRGIGDAAREHGSAIIGGDTVATPRGILISITIFGETDAPVLRSGAEPGDGLYLAGPVGESALGLSLLRAIGKPVPLEDGTAPSLEDLPPQSLARILRRHVLPELPAVPKGASAMIDVSDGLLMDALHLAEASGVGLRIEKNLIPLGVELNTLSQLTDQDPLKLALHGGEDYALLFTLRPDREAPATAVRIGTVTEAGTVLLDADGTERPFGAEGWDHFLGTSETAARG